MTFDEKTRRYTLSGGRSFHACMGVLGLLHHDGGLGETAGRLVDGFDNLTVLDEEEAAPPEERKGFTPAEKKEIAMHMMARWLTWSGAMPAGCSVHPTALETCEDCPRVDLHVKVSLTPGAVRAMMTKPGAA